MKEDRIACPSSVCEEGAQLLGVVQEDGRVAILSQPLPVNEEFVQMARQQPSVETRFRFSGTCVEKGCKQWSGHSCGVIEKVLQLEAIEEQLTGLPKCAIRQNCRWYLQEGKEACVVCPLIVTDSREEENIQSTTTRS